VASVLEERTGRHCLFVFSGRLALYLALRTWLSPSDRIPAVSLDDDISWERSFRCGRSPSSAFSTWAADFGNPMAHYAAASHAATTAAAIAQAATPNRRLNRPPGDPASDPAAGRARP
jgi:hypothetical protein